MLNKIDVENLMNQLRVELLGSSDMLLTSMLYQVGTEFLDATSLWTEHVQINAIAGQNSYAVTPTEGQIIRLDGTVYIDGTGHTYFIPGLMPDITDGIFVATHAPANPQTWLCGVTKNLSLPTLKHGVPIAPEFLLKQWFLAMKHGILGEMMNMPDKSWSNSKGALYHMSKFRSYIQQGRVIKLKANTNGASAWRFPQGYRVNSQQGGVPSFGGGERTF